MNKILYTSMLGMLSLVTINNSYAYKIINWNDNTYVGIEGNIEHINIYKSSRNLYDYKTSGKSDSLYKSNLSFSRFSYDIKYNDKSLNHRYLSYNSLYLGLITSAEYSYLSISAKLKVKFDAYTKDFSLINDVRVSNQILGSLIYYSNRQNHKNEFTPKALVSVQDLNGDYYAYETAKLELFDSSLYAGVFSIYKHKFNYLVGSFIDSLDYNIFYRAKNKKQDHLVNISEPINTGIKIKNNYGLYINYKHNIDELNSIYIKADYKQIKYDAEIKMYIHKANHWHSVKGKAKDNILKVSLGYYFDNFKFNYTYGKTNAIGDTILTDKDESKTPSEKTKYKLYPKLVGNYNSITIEYTPNILDNKLDIAGTFDLYKDKITNGNETSLVKIGGSNASVSGHKAYRYTLDLKYYVHNNVFVNFRSYFDKSITSYNITSNDSFTSSIDEFNQYLLMTVSF